MSHIDQPPREVTMALQLDEDEIKALERWVTEDHSRDDYLFLQKMVKSIAEQGRALIDG